ncbi:ABC transporter permease, partial [Escherichia coli]|nr:ABC transporter permease [Escherichia coli]
MNARIRLTAVGAFRRLAGLLLAAAAMMVSAAPAHADMAKIRQSGALKVALYKG